MGHRREVFRPRKSREKIKRSFEKNLNEKKFDKAVQLAISHYITRSAGRDFGIALIAASEAISLAKELAWSRAVEDIANMAISVAENRADKRLSKFRRHTVFELVTKTLEKVKEES